MSSGGTRTIRLRVLPLLVVALPAVLALVLARSGEATAASKPQILVATHHYIGTFAQDGGRIAWIARTSATRCALQVKTIRTGRTATTSLKKYDCGDQYDAASHLALADRTAAWVEGYSCGNTECFWRVATATAGARRARVVDRQDVGCPPPACDGGLGVVSPLLAGAGDLLAYSNGNGVVERIRGGGTHRLFSIPDGVDALALGNDLIATTSTSLDLGDSCGCLDVPAWSPDGSKIAYLQGTFGPEGSSASVAIMNADGSGRHQITAGYGLGGGEPLSLSWSPDGTKIAYDTLSLGEKIAVANADGSGSAQLTSGTSPAWSPDGTKIAFTRADYTANTAGIFVVGPDGNNVRNLASFGPPVGLNNPPNLGEVAWSPDGTRIAFSLDGVLQVMNADGTDLRELGPVVVGDEPAWSPDGSQIVFHDAGGLAVIGADGSGLHQITDGPDEHPSWSPDGKTIVFASDRIDPYAGNGIYNDNQYLELYVVDPDGSNLRPLSFTRPATWENTLAVHSGRGKLVSAVTAPGLGLRLPVIAGKIAAVGESVGGVDQITLFDAHTGRQLAVVQVGQGNGQFEVIGADARWIAFRIGTTISAFNLSTHRVVRLARVAAGTVFISVSGRRVAWAENLGQGRKRLGRIRAVELPS